VKTGTIHEAMKKIEQLTCKSISLHHELDCRRGEITSEFHFFIGRDLMFSAQKWEAVIDELNFILLGYGT